MSAPGHCTHCWAGGDGCHIGSRDHGSAHSNWNDGHCPACDEAERIAQMCDEEAATAGPELLPDYDARAQTWQAAANLARGRR